MAGLTTGGEAVASGVVIGGFDAMGPVYATLSGLSIQQISVFMAIPGITTVLFAWPPGRVCGRFERSEGMLTPAAVSALACVAGGNQSPLVIALSGVFMGSCAALYPVAVAIANDRMHAHRVVAASSGLLLSYGLGSCIGPPLPFALMTWLGTSGLFTTNALVLVMLCVAGLYRVRHSPPMPVAEQEHFIPTLPVAPMITELDPRNENFVEAEAMEAVP